MATAESEDELSEAALRDVEEPQNRSPKRSPPQVSRKLKRKGRNSWSYQKMAS
jgi:hypothetical protein